jgi:hypothetical protein
MEPAEPRVMRESRNLVGKADNQVVVATGRMR